MITTDSETQLPTEHRRDIAKAFDFFWDGKFKAAEALLNTDELRTKGVEASLLWALSGDSSEADETLQRIDVLEQVISQESEKSGEWKMLRYFSWKTPSRTTILTENYHAAVLAWAYFLRGVMQLARGSSLRAGICFKSSLNSFQSLSELPGDDVGEDAVLTRDANSLRKFGNGMLSIIVARLPAGMFFGMATMILGVTGDVLRGQQLLQECMEEGGHMAPFAQIVLTTSHLEASAR
ncbi:hypothetical protein CYMTET_19151, partial [Cymbomonas tetramitiformis]